MLPLLVSTPHSSGEVPPAILGEMLKTGEPETELRSRIFREGDPFTDGIFRIAGAAVTVNAKTSRFVVDLNRERNEGGENGVIKRTDFDRRPFYTSDFILSEDARKRRLTEYYDPYHRAISAAIRGGSIRFLIDGHSMTAVGPAIGPDQGKPRPALCIGNFGDGNGAFVSSPLSCPPELAVFIRDQCRDVLADMIAESGLPAPELNQPFDGGHILRKYSSPNLPGIMIEINRALYLDEKTLEPLPGRIPRLQEGMERLFTELCDRL